MTMFELPVMNELTRVLASLTLVLLAALISRWQSLDLEKQMLVSVKRCLRSIYANGAIGLFLILCRTALHGAELEKTMRLL